ncbi:site-specific integrase [Hamadaea sp. NPDC050747]|uniref:tyrosine-type recombinase/integrase n=1 Tax=Hamadaea sp. NPDC050747 TaxID=3155789 RepID=UPI0033FBB1C4
MAWFEQHGDGYRVRYRHAGKVITDSTHPKLNTARLRVAQLHAIQAKLASVAVGTVPTVQQWADVWLPKHLCSPVTRDKYTSMVNTHILPAFGDEPLTAIDKLRVEEFAGVLLTKMAPTSARTVVTLLGTMIRDAVDAHYAVSDPTARLRIAGGPLPQRPVATPAQVWQVACRMPTMCMLVLVVTAAYTGMRFQELTALDRSNVHLGDAVLKVDEFAGALHFSSAGTWLGPPKTDESARTIDLPPFLVHGLGLVLAGHDEPTVFCTPSGGWLDPADFRNRMWDPACNGDRRIGWEPIIAGMRLGDLRHTHRTWMDDDNIREVLAAKRLGHLLPDIRKRYGNVVTPRMRTKLIKKLEKRWQASGAVW